MNFIEMHGAIINLDYVTKLYQDTSPGAYEMQYEIHICTTDGKETVFNYPKAKEEKMKSDWKWLREKVII